MSDQKMVFVSYSFAGGDIRNIVVEFPEPISSAQAVSELRMRIGDNVSSGGLRREDYDTLIAIVSWQRLELA